MHTGGDRVRRGERQPVASGVTQVVGWKSVCATSWCYLSQIDATKYYCVPCFQDSRTSALPCPGEARTMPPRFREGHEKRARRTQGWAVIRISRLLEGCHHVCNFTSVPGTKVDCSGTRKTQARRYVRKCRGLTGRGAAAATLVVRRMSVVRRARRCRVVSQSAQGRKGRAAVPARRACGG